MPKKLVQVSSDRGMNWKKRWVDPAEFDPNKSNLVAGDWVRRSEEHQIFIVSIRDERLYTQPLKYTNKFTYSLWTGQEIIVQAETKNEADSTFVQILMSKGLLKRSSEEIII